MKIALFTYATKPRGSVIHTLELAEALHNLNHQVTVFALDKDGMGFDYPGSCDYQLIPTKPAAVNIDALISQRIEEFVSYLSNQKLDYDCYHAQDCISANALANLVQQQKIPHFVRTVHHIEDYSSVYLQQCQDLSIVNADLCLCVSQTWQQALESEYQIKAPRVINGVNTRRFCSILDGSEEGLKHRLSLNGSPIYLTIGGIEPRKNSQKLLEAFALVLNDYPQAQLVLVGGATIFNYKSYREEFFALAEYLEIKIGRSLILPGVVPDLELPALYRIADAFVFPSIKEGWGLVVLEAIASGIPVITANQPPFTEFLTDTQAMLVDPHAVEAIAQAMVSIFQSNLADFLVHQSQAIISRYTWEVSAKMHLDHYQQLLANHA